MSLVSEGKIGEREVRLDGTGFAWLDETVYETSGDQQRRLEPRESDEVVLNLLFTSALFDPTVDFRALPPAERQRVEQELAQGDVLLLRVRRGDRLIAGDELAYTRGGEVPESAPYLASVDLVLGARPLEAGAEYPDVVERLGRGLAAQLDVGAVEPRLLGVVDVRVTRQPDDDHGAEGELTVRFDVERVSERVAECNFDPGRASHDGSVDPCDELRYTAE